MDPIIFSRVAMVGYLFLAVFIGSLWSTDSLAWQKLLAFLQQKDTSALVVAIVGLLAGIAAPPALGFLLERVVTLVLVTTKRNLMTYPAVKKFNESLAGKLPASAAATLQGLTGEAAFHVYFHTYAEPNLLDWSRRRVAQVYASATGSLAIVGALLCGILVVQSVHWGFLLLCLLFAAVLVNDARLQSNAHQATVSAWIRLTDLTRRSTDANA